MGKKSLTLEQQDLVTQNHNLIYDFAKRKNLVIEEYYDILAIGLCNAALYYDSSKGKFSTLANLCMSNAVKDYWRNISADSKISEDLILSYDASKSGDEAECGDAFIDRLTDGISIQDMVLSNISCDALMGVLNEKEKKVVRGITKGLTSREIAKIIDCTHQYVSVIKTNIKKKWKPLLQA